MKKAFFLILVLQLITFLSFGQTKVQNFLTENLDNHISVGVSHPRFSWQLNSDKGNVLQTAYEIKVVSNKSVIWNPGKVQSDQSVHVPYGGSPLQSGKKYSWQVRVWDNDGKASSWSVPAFFQMGLLDKSDWKAKWIEPGFQEDSPHASPIIRKEFSLNKKIVSATAYITSHGLYEAHLNGKRFGDAHLTPGWTSYNKRLQYQAYDVTNLLKNGSNAIGVDLGNGWYRGTLAWGGNKDIYGKDAALLFLLNVTYSDGSQATII